MFNWIKRAYRAYRAFRNSVSTLSNPVQEWLRDAWTGGQSIAGVSVNPQTAMGIATYFACIRNISEDLATLPWAVFKRNERGREKRTDHPVHRLIHDAPNENMTAFTFIETLTSHALGWRSGYAEIVRNNAGQPVAMYPLDPNSVTKEVSADGRRFRFRVTVPGMNVVYLDDMDVLEIHGLGYDGLTGYAMTMVARDQLGVTIATQNYAGRWFGNGVQPSGVVECPLGFSQEAMKNLKASFAERHEGEENKARTLMLNDGVTWKSVSVDAQKAMLIEASEWQVEEICRRFRMPTDKVGHHKRAQGWSSLEQRDVDYVRNCLTPWAVRWEKEIQRKLFRQGERAFYVKADFRGLLRGDSAGRAAMYQALFNVGGITQNEIRELEDMEPVDGGDKTWVQGAMVPVDLLIEKTEAEIEKLKEPTPAPVAAPAAKPAPEPENRLSTLITLSNAHEALMIDALSRVLKVEATKVTQAKKKGSTDGLRDSFYKDHPAYVTAAIGPVVEAFWVAATGDRPDFGLIREMAQAHTNSSLEDMTDDQLVSRWETGERATYDAKALMAKMVERVAK